MATHHNPQDLIGRTAVDSAGDKIGKIGQVYIDDTTGHPVWVTVSTGRFGNRESFAPLEGSTMSGSELRLDVTKHHVKDAPTVDNDGKLGKEQQDLLYRHYADNLPAHLRAGADKKPDDAKPDETKPAESAADEITAADDSTAEIKAADEPRSDDPAPAEAAAAAEAIAPETAPQADSAPEAAALDGAGSDNPATDDAAPDDVPAAAAIADPDLTDVDEPGVENALDDSLDDTVDAEPGGTTQSPDAAADAGTQPDAEETSRAPIPVTDDGLKTVTRSEERLQIAKEQFETGRVRIRRTIVTEEVTHSIPVSHEELHIERIPIDESEIATAEPVELGEHEHEITLHGERPVVSKTTVPVERYRIGSRIVTEQHEVNETLRKEQIDLDGDGIPDYLQTTGAGQSSDRSAEHSDAASTGNGTAPR